MIVSSILIRPTPRGSLNRRGPAEPELKSSVLPNHSAFG